MKKIFSILVFALVAIACENEVVFNDPGFQARKDNRVWRGDVTSGDHTPTDPAVPNSGKLTITSYNGLEVTTISFPLDLSVAINAANAQTFTYGYNPTEPTLDDDISASYTFTDGGTELEYVTGLGFNTDREDPGNLQIVVTKWDPERKVISGTFKFNAKYQGESTLAADNVNFQEGNFYNIAVF